MKRNARTTHALGNAYTLAPGGPDHAHAVGRRQIGGLQHRREAGIVVCPHHKLRVDRHYLARRPFAGT